MILGWPMVLVRGEDAHWLLQILRPRLREWHREKVKIEAPPRLCADLEHLEERHRESMQTKLSDLHERNNETRSAADC